MLDREDRPARQQADHEPRAIGDLRQAKIAAAGGTEDFAPQGVDIFFPFFKNHDNLLIFETSAAARGGKEKRR